MINATVIDHLLRGSEVAEVIGCSRAMAYRLMQRGTIPVVRIPGGKTVRGPRESLLEWIKVNPRAGIEVHVMWIGCAMRSITSDGTVAGAVRSAHTDVDGCSFHAAIASSVQSGTIAGNGGRAAAVASAVC